ncbi:hypothetical protein CR152_11490 [Massilia violaceinigra]|uniref:Uncharacterized protein n=1 Tax=Massilia violaceinigra TaxID=2045208 RepID=A0A2D2DJC2_9BURK|nr:hypothetical protein [Massilia violaceinigra]ATQ75074.1 hypothetical protein CR152_11490 [Massilia violaceinigra]
MPTTKDAFHAAHNALSTIELYIGFNQGSSDFEKRKSEVETALLLEAQNYQQDAPGRRVLTAMAEAVQGMHLEKAPASLLRQGLPDSKIVIG